MSPRIACTTLVCLALSACAEPSTAPLITELKAQPASLPVGARGSIDGEVSFRDNDGNVRQIALGFVDPSGVLSEALPELTGATDGLLIGTVPFRLSITPQVTGTHRLSVRLIDAESQSSEAAEQDVVVQ